MGPSLADNCRSGEHRAQPCLAKRDYRIEASVEVISQTVGTILGEIFQTATCGPDARSRSEIVLVEALNNISEHAYRNNPGTITIRACIMAEHIVFETCDSGRPMPGLCPPDPCCPDHEVELLKLPEGGYGWYLIRTLASSLEYARMGEENHLRIALSRFD